MFTLNELAIANGVDLTKINPYSSTFDQQVEMANQMVRKWMKNPKNKAYLDEKKANYIHDKGWTYYNGKRGNMKHEVDIPSEAFIMLPKEIRDNKKELMRWVKEKHPYLMHNQIT